MTSFCLGLILGNGEAQKEMRRFSLLSMRDFGVGKKSIDDVIQTEANLFCEYLGRMADKNNGNVSDMKPKCQWVTTNIIHNVIFGFR